VGVILYLPTDDPKIRQDITTSFGKYARRVETTLLPKYNGAWHWGKLEIDRIDSGFLKKRLNEKLPIHLVTEHRSKFDPKKILDNRITNAVFQP